MWAYKESLMKTVPKLYSSEDVKTEDKIIHAHFFVGGCDWWCSEWDGKDIMFGYACLGDWDMSEWGYISLAELKDVKVQGVFEVEMDNHWTPKKWSDVLKEIGKR